MKSISWFAIVLLAGHALLAGIGAWSLWVISAGLWLGLAAAVVFVIAYAFVWRRWVAPASPARLGYKERVGLHLILGPAIVVLATFSSTWLIGIVGVSLTLLGDALGRNRAAEVESI